MGLWLTSQQLRFDPRLDPENSIRGGPRSLISISKLSPWSKLETSYLCDERSL